MKSLSCPYCQETYRLHLHEAAEFYETHVVACRKTEQIPRRWTPVVRILDAVRSKLVIRPQLTDSLYFRGHGLMRLMRNGELIDVGIGRNLIVTTGRGLVIDRLQAASPAVPDFEAIGTGTTAAAAGDTTLQTEIGTRVQGTLSQPAQTTDRLVSNFAAGNGTGAITEAGRLNAASAGVLVSRIVFAVINKGASDALETTHDITD